MLVINRIIEQYKDEEVIEEDLEVSETLQFDHRSAFTIGKHSQPCHSSLLYSSISL